MSIELRTTAHQFPVAEKRHVDQRDNGKCDRSTIEVVMSGLRTSGMTTSAMRVWSETS